MSCGNKWKTLAIGFIPLALVAVWLGHPLFGGKRPGGTDGPARTLEGHGSPVQALAFAPDGRTLTSVAYRPHVPGPGVEVAVWDVGAGTPRAKHTAPLGCTRCLALAPGGRALAAAQERSVWLWDMDSPHERRLLAEYRSAVCALAFSDDGSRLAAADLDKEGTFYDVATGRALAPCQGGVEYGLALAFAPDGKTLAGGGRDPAVCLWDTASGEQLGALRGHVRFLFAVAFSPDGRSLASGDRAGVVKVWEVESLAQRLSLEISEDEVTAVAFSPDGRVLAVAAEQTVQLWDAATGVLLARLHGHEGKVKCLAYSPDGALLASGGHDRTVRLWDVARYRP
jgi:WD40 repeat protein